MGSLAKELDMFAEALIDRTCMSNASILRKIAAAAEAREADFQPVRAGDSAPDFTLPDTAGHRVTLSERLAHGPVVLTFIQGGWNPFCEITLRAYEAIRPALRRAGADVLAISPQAKEENRMAVESNWLSLPLLSDFGSAVARTYGLMRPLDEDKRAMMIRLGHDVPRLNGTVEWELPLTATYVIAPDGRVVRAHLDPRVMRRMEPADALAAVRALKVTASG